MKFSQKNFENWRFWKTAILKNWPFWIFFAKKNFFFCFIPVKISHKLCGRMDGTQFWCFLWFPANSLLCVIYCYTVYISLVSTLNLILNVLCQVLWVWFTKKQPDTPCNDHKKIWIGQLKTKEQQDPFWKKIIFILCLMRISHTLPLQSVTFHNGLKYFLKRQGNFNIHSASVWK